MEFLSHYCFKYFFCFFLFFYYVFITSFLVYLVVPQSLYILFLFLIFSVCFVCFLVLEVSTVRSSSSEILSSSMHDLISPSKGIRPFVTVFLISSNFFVVLLPLDFYLSAHIAHQFLHAICLTIKTLSIVIWLFKIQVQ